MKTANLAHVPAEQRQSPGGKSAKTIKEISIALGREPESLDLAKRHPFDLTLVRIPPGKSYCPYHSHGAESELYLVISGRGRVYATRMAHPKLFPETPSSFGPGEAHQLTNNGTEDFAYYVIADNPRHDSCYYPDSGKWAVNKESPRLHHRPRHRDRLLQGRGIMPLIDVLPPESIAEGRSPNSNRLC